jgi:hypothetical protein
MPTTTVPTDNSRYFLFGADSHPARIRTPQCVPEVLRNGQWEPFYNSWAWMHGAEEVDEIEWQARVDEVSK